MTITEKLLNELNELRGLKYPEKGYLYFADIKGDGRNIKSVYICSNSQGGHSVSYAGSSLNDICARKRCAKIRAVIASEKAV
jgi:hypothetical protein